jgi:hypothetical protein
VYAPTPTLVYFQGPNLTVFELAKQHVAEMTTLHYIRPAAVNQEKTGIGGCGRKALQGRIPVRKPVRSIRTDTLERYG